jgi:hypothetical protein
MISLPEDQPTALPRFEQLVNRIQHEPDLNTAKILTLLSEFQDAILHIVGSVDGRYSFVVGNDRNKGIELTVNQPSAKENNWHMQPGTITIHIYDTARAIITLRGGKKVESALKTITVLPQDERIVPFANNKEVKPLKLAHTAPDSVDPQGKALFNSEDVVDYEEVA